MLRIWGRRNSVNVQKVMWAVGELGLPHERIDAGGPFGGIDTDEFTRMNPNRRVPVIDDEGTIVWESHAIVRYLAQKYGGGSLAPFDPGHHARSDMWMDWVAADLQPGFIGGVFWSFYRTPEAQRNWQAIRRGLQRTTALLQLLDTWLTDRRFVAGNTLTMGDIAVGAQLFRYFTLEIERAPLPNVQAYYTTLGEREAYRTHIMVPYDDLKGRLAF